MKGPIAIASIVIALGIAPASVGAHSLTAEPSPGAKHLLSFNRAFNKALAVAGVECALDASCITYAVGPTCTSGTRHRWRCLVHKITGVPGDQAQQQDCTRPLQVLIKRASGKKLFSRFLSAGYICGPNLNYPGI